MKKIITMFFAVIVCLAVFAGCGSKDVKLDDVISDINSTYSLSLKTIETSDDLNKYYGIEPDSVKQFAAEIDSNNNAPVEIVLVEAVDSDAAAKIETALAARYNSILSQYASYTPDKLDMVKSCEVTKDGNFVSLIVAENADAMLEDFKKSIE